MCITQGYHISDRCASLGKKICGTKMAVTYVAQMQEASGPAHNGYRVTVLGEPETPGPTQLARRTEYFQGIPAPTEYAADADAAQAGMIRNSPSIARLNVEYHAFKQRVDHIVF